MASHKDRKGNPGELHEADAVSIDPDMRLYDCFEIEDLDASSPGKAVRATDLRCGRKILLHRWHPEHGELLADQQKAKEICEPAGSEFFCDGKSLWLIESTEGNTPATLAKLRAAGLFTTPAPVVTAIPTATPAPAGTPLPGPLRCVQCGLPCGKNSALCPACLKQVEINRKKAQPKRSRAKPVLLTAAAIVALVLVLIGLGVRAVYRLVLAELPPTAALSADRLLINKGECIRLTWTSSNARSASIAPGLGVRPLNGQAKVCPVESTTYNLAVLGSGGSSAQQVRVTVRRSARSGNGDKSSFAAKRRKPQRTPPATREVGPPQSRNPQ